MALHFVNSSGYTSLFIAISLSAVVLIFSSLAIAECPRCYTNNDRPMDGHGPAPDGSGRRRIHIKIHDSWGTQTNSAIWEGTLDAADAWNNATDGANPPNKTGYYFMLQQGETQPDYIIKQGTVEGGNCASVNTVAGPPYTITLPASTASLGEDDIKAIIAHEIGHPIGLANDDNCPSIMNHASPGCSLPHKTPRPNDVLSVNKNFGPSRSTDCTGSIGASYLATPSPTPLCNQQQAEDCINSLGQWIEEVCQCDHSIGPHTPILIDVGGNGFNLTNAAQGVNFDLNNDSQTERLAWTTPESDDMFLVLDRNGNGVIDNGSELFGDLTPQPSSTEPNGFIALAQFDKRENGGNEDALITDSDSVFAALRLWRDANHNGFSEASEMRPLNAMGVHLLELDYKISKRTDEQGNYFRYRAKVKDIHGNQIGRWAWDVFLLGQP